MNFLVEKTHGKVIHDFAFHLLQAVEYANWSGRDKIRIKFLDPDKGSLSRDITKPDKYIPVGSNEFVSRYLRQFFPQAERALHPLNVPQVLFPYAGRRIANIGKSSDLDIFHHNEKVFVKSNTVIKDKDNGMQTFYRNPHSALFQDKILLDKYEGKQLSTVVKIDSEWRVLVFHNRIVHIANYAGDCRLFPDVSRITRMVEVFSETAPVAYTLDVGVYADTFVLECHRFFSCGLYGFQDYSKLPYMLSQAWYEMLKIR